MVLKYLSRFPTNVDLAISAGKRRNSDDYLRVALFENVYSDVACFLVCKCIAELCSESFKICGQYLHSFPALHSEREGSG